MGVGRLPNSALCSAPYPLTFRARVGLPEQTGVPMSERPYVLVADDDPDIRDLVVFKLGQSGYRTTAVGDGSSALERIRSEHPDLVVLDVMMPGLSGLDVLREVRADASLADVAVILLTARSRDDDVDQGFGAGGGRLRGEALQSP